MAFVGKLIRAVTYDLIKRIPLVGGLLAEFAGWTDTATQDQINDLIRVQNRLKIKLKTQKKVTDALTDILSGPDAETGPLREPLEELAAALAKPKALAAHTAAKLDTIARRFNDNFGAFDDRYIRIFAPYLLGIITPQARLALLERAAPGGDLLLLCPDTRATDLIGRDENKTEFMAWLNSEAPISIRVIVGRAGAGKTRFALELMDELGANDQWITGFVDLQKTQTFNQTSGLTQTQWPQPAFLVVDYAAIETSPLKEWLTHITGLAREDSRVRILLIERNADTQRGWLSELLAWGGVNDPGLAGVFDPPEPITLTPLTLDDDCADRRQILQTMLTRIGLEKGKALPELPPPGQDERFDRAIQAPQWKDPLYLMMAALVAGDSEVVTALTMSRTDLDRDLAQREIERLKRGATEGPDRILRVYLSACATFARGLDAPRARGVAALLEEQTDLQYTGGRGALIGDLSRLQPGESAALGAVSPDIIAEAFVYLGLNSGQPPLDAAQRNAILLKLIELTNEGPLKTLMLLIQDYAAVWPDVLDWLEHLVQHARDDDFSLLVRIADELPHYTLVLREKAVDILTAVTQRLKAIPIPSDPDASVRQRGETARSLNNLANRLSAVGRCDEALDTALEAIEIYRKLADERTDVFEPYLAAVLINLAATLSDVGRRDEAADTAREAVDICRKLANERPVTFEPFLAGSLTNLGNILSDVGRRNEALDTAQKAVEIYRKLADERPDAFGSNLAMSLSNLAARLGDVGRRDEAVDTAREANDISRKLADERPDAFLPDLAISLINLANMLSNVGGRDKALDTMREAVEIYRKLADERPDAFGSNLAESLGNLANRLHDVGRSDEALDTARQAVDIFRKLANERPVAFLPNLAKSLSNLAAMLSAVGRHHDALETASEAVDIYRKLADECPDAFEPDLARSLNNLAGMLSYVGRPDEAVDTAQEAVEIHCKLADECPDVFLPDLAMSLSNLANMLSDVGRLDEAMDTAREAVDIRRKLADERPEVFLPDLVRSLRTLHLCHKAKDQLPEARDAITEALGLLTPLFLKQPQAFAGLIGQIVRDYQDCVKALDEAPDVKLLNPVLAALTELYIAKMKPTPKRTNTETSDD